MNGIDTHPLKDESKTKTKKKKSDKKLTSRTSSDRDCATHATNGFLPRDELQPKLKKKKSDKILQRQEKSDRDGAMDEDVHFLKDKSKLEARRGKKLDRMSMSSREKKEYKVSDKQNKKDSVTVMTCYMMNWCKAL